MPGSNFVVQNGLTVGALSVDASTGSLTTTGSITVSAPGTINVDNIAVSGIAKNDTSLNIYDTGTGSNISIKIDNVTEHVLTQDLTTLNGNLLVNTTGYLQVPAGNSAQRPGTAANGMVRYNSSITSFEGYAAGAWSSLGGVRSVDGFTYILAETSAGASNGELEFYVENAAGTGTTKAGGWTASGLTIAGNLTVNGTQTTVNSTVVTVDDILIELGDVASPTDVTANGGGILLKGATNKTITWSSVGWNSSEDFNLVTGKAYEINGTSVLNATTLGSGVTASSLTSVGTLTGLTVSGAIIPNSNVSVNLGSTSAWWNIIYGKATQAQYADLAENYQADKPYPAGTVLMFGGSSEVTTADADTTAVAGVVSMNPAHLMNGGLTGFGVVPLALQGRVPCNVIGPVKKGDMMISAGFGYAKTSADPKVGQVIGKALQDFTGVKGQIEVVVGRV